jgi:hypothetical protein
MEMAVWRHGPGGSSNQAVTEVPPPARMSVIPMAVATDRRIVGMKDIRKALTSG